MLKSSIKSLIKHLFFGTPNFDTLIEGVYADQYQDPQMKQQIRDRYVAMHTVEKTPLTDPLDFDPCEPPAGWLYDPYYETWIKLND
jgi:hypothetical protein